jgi:hypothetical protein
VKIRQVNVSDSDKMSARAFFDALGRFWDLKSRRALDAFARNGQLTVQMYTRLALGTYIEAWELGEEHREALVNLGVSTVHIGDSYARAEAFQDKFDMVVIDTPQGAHHDSTGAVHFEHFDFFRLTLQNLLKDQGLVVLYVNKHPYDKNEVGSHGYDEYDEYDFGAWMQTRAKFYDCDVGYAGTLAEEYMIKAYRRVASEQGWSLGSMLTVPCFSDVPGRAPYAFRLALELRRA